MTEADPFGCLRTRTATAVARATGLVLVAGGTRGTGREVVRLLVTRGYPVRVLARNRTTAATLLEPAVEIVEGDITLRHTLDSAVRDVEHIIFTAGVPSGKFAREPLVKAADHDGVLNMLAAARAQHFRGRFVYLNSVGITTPSLWSVLLNLYKSNTLVWRRKVEDHIRASGVDYTIIRVGFLLNTGEGRRRISITQGALPLSPRYRIARADAAEAFVEALEHPRASRTTFEAAWGRGPRQDNWDAVFGALRTDDDRRSRPSS